MTVIDQINVALVSYYFSKTLKRSNFWIVVHVAKGKLILYEENKL